MNHTDRNSYDVIVMRLDKGAQTPKSFANCKEILISYNKTCVKDQSVSKQKNEKLIKDNLSNGPHLVSTLGSRMSP